MREMEIKAVMKPHALTLEGRAHAVITGVEDVDSFNEQMVVLNTTAGTLTLLGDALHVSKLNLEEGQLLVDGHIVAFEYDESVKSGRKGLMGRLFR